MSPAILCSTGIVTRDPDVADRRRYLLPGEGSLELQGFLSGLVECK